jgi:hypothetical protein
MYKKNNEAQFSINSMSNDEIKKINVKRNLKKTDVSSG